MSDASGTQASAEVPPLVPLRRNRGFRMLWTGQLLSDTGTELSRLAYPLLILALTHSAVLAGLAGTARAITVLCLQLPAGALSDRFDRRLTMIICDVMRAVLLAVLAIGVAVHLASWPVVMIVGLVEGGASAIFNPAAAAALPAIVPDAQLEEAWAATEARTYGASLAGPALGGVLFGLGQALPFLADAVSYAALVRHGEPDPRAVPARSRRPRARRCGARWPTACSCVWQVPILRAVVITAPLVNFAFTGVLFTITLALRQHGTSTTVIGLVQAAIAVGGLLGAVVAPRLQGRMRLGTLATAIDAGRGADVRRCGPAHPVTAGGGAGRACDAARAGRERRAGRRDAPQRAGGNARPGQQHRAHGGYRAGGAGAADGRPARRAHFRCVGDGCLRRHDGRGGRARPGHAWPAAGTVPGGTAQ